MKKILTMLIVIMMLINIMPVYASTYDTYQKGDKIEVKVNDTTTLEFYVLEDSGKDSDSIKAIYSGVLDGKYNYGNAKSSLNNLKSTWKNVISVTLPSMEEIFGSNVDLSKSFTYTKPALALSNSRYWTLNQTTISVDSKSLKDSIMKDNNNGISDVNIDFSKVSSDTNGKGLYYTSTNTEDNKTTYYFRGDVNNNYVKFGKDSSGNDLIWRIVRINEDGSIRLVTQTAISATTFNINNDDNAHVGYMFGSTGKSSIAISNAYELTHSNSNSSSAKSALDAWYYANLYNLSEQIADSGFCNDRSLYSGPGTSNRDTYYGAYNRLVNEKKPQFACPQTNDLFTTNNSTKGNKALTYPVGLLTADEVAYAGGIAGGSYKNDNTSTYLKNYSNYLYHMMWTMSPYSYNGAARVWYVNFGSSTESTMCTVDCLLDVRPVINLKQDATITKGNGTSDNPYVIDVNNKGNNSEVAWTLGGTETGAAQVEEISSELSVKPVITILKEYIEKTNNEDEPTIPDDEGEIDKDDETGKDDSELDDGKGDVDDVTNPETGDNIIILTCTVLILGGVALYTHRRRKINN